MGEPLLLRKLKQLLEENKMDLGLMKGWVAERDPKSRNHHLYDRLQRNSFETAEEALEYLKIYLRKAEERKRKKAEAALSLTPKKTRQEKWNELVEQAEMEAQTLMQDYWENGYFIVKDVFNLSLIQELLEGIDLSILESEQNHRLKRRAQIVRQVWHGARAMIQIHREAGGGACAVRAKGRYDYQLPSSITPKVDKMLEEKGLLKVLKSICPKATVRTENVMLSAPGSERQVIHVDSAWEAVSFVDPLPHYITVLVPLTVQDEETGGTRIWPKSHRNYHNGISPTEGYVDMVEPLLNVGDALVFDGLLSHCGLENKSKDRDRYFFYLAFSSRHDPNTDSTG
jgi:ectoine hydroxylase-related dioxygenase (phytanoyl-CoA dioxygenase family)